MNAALSLARKPTILAMSSGTPNLPMGFFLPDSAVGLSNRSVIYIYRILHMAMKQAERRGLVVRNIARLVSPPRLETKPVEPWTPEEATIVPASNQEREARTTL